MKGDKWVVVNPSMYFELGSVVEEDVAVIGGIRATFNDETNTVSYSNIIEYNKLFKNVPTRKELNFVLNNYGIKVHDHIVKQLS